MGISGTRGDLRKDVENGDLGRERGDLLEVFYPDAASSTGGRPNTRVSYGVSLLEDLRVLRVLFSIAASAALRCVVLEVRFFLT